jgi:hypothetical protein
MPAAVPAADLISFKDLLPIYALPESIVQVTAEEVAVQRIELSKLLSFRILPTVFCSLDASSSWLPLAVEADRATDAGAVSSFFWGSLIAY